MFPQHSLDDNEIIEHVLGMEEDDEEEWDAKDEDGMQTKKMMPKEADEELKSFVRFV